MSCLVFDMVQRADEAMGSAVHERLVQQLDRLGSYLAAIPREDQEQGCVKAVKQLYSIARLVQMGHCILCTTVVHTSSAHQDVSLMRQLQAWD